MLDICFVSNPWPQENSEKYIPFSVSRVGVRIFHPESIASNRTHIREVGLADCFAPIAGLQHERPRGETRPLRAVALPLGATAALRVASSRLEASRRRRAPELRMCGGGGSTWIRRDQSRG